MEKPPILWLNVAVFIITFLVALIAKINDFYAVKKQLMTSRKARLIADVEGSDLMTQVQELKHRLIEQRRSWQLLVEKLA